MADDDDDDDDDDRRFCRRRRRRGVLLDAMPLADDDVDLDGDDQRICRCCCVLLYAMPLAPPLLAIINQSFVYLLSCFLVLVLVLFVCLFFAVGVADTMNGSELGLLMVKLAS